MSMQKQSGRNLVISPYAQAAYGGVLADDKLIRRLQFDSGSVLELAISRRSDQADAGKGTEFATNGQPTDRDTKMSLKREAEAWWMGWMQSFLFGQKITTGAGPYRHTSTFPNINSTLVPTSVYVEETADIHYKAPDICVSSLSLSIPSRGALMATLELMGTGRKIPGSMGALPDLPVLAPADYLLGSDMKLNITPSGGGVTPFAGRLRSATVKLDNQGSPFKSVGDGLNSGSVNSGQRKHSLDLQIAALPADDINGWFENDIELAISLGTDPALLNQVGFSWPAAHVKANKLGNDGELVVWGVSLDETTCYQKAGVAAVSMYTVNGVADYLMAA
jgi:hypothetical protein